MLCGFKKDNKVIIESHRKFQGGFTVIYYGGINRIRNSEFHSMMPHTLN